MQGAEPKERPETDKVSPHSYPYPTGSWGAGGAHVTRMDWSGVSPPQHYSHLGL